MYHQEKIAIYGLFNGNICLYVGQSVNPHKRWWRLTRCGEKRKGGLFILPDAKLKVFKWVSKAESNQAEKDMIAFYKAKGQAEHNRRIIGATHLMNGTAVRVEGFDLPFESLAAASRALGTCAKHIHAAIRRNEPLHCWKGGKRHRAVAYA